MAPLIMYATQNREEFKFVLSPGLGDALRSCISRHLAPDSLEPDGYWVCSEYYDTPGLHNYWEKLLDVPSRRHLRSRSYTSSGPSIPRATFIEVKHKCDGAAVKRRIPVAGEDVDAQRTPQKSDFQVSREIIVSCNDSGFSLRACLTRLNVNRLLVALESSKSER